MEQKTKPKKIGRSIWIPLNPQQWEQVKAESRRQLRSMGAFLAHLAIREVERSKKDESAA